MDKICSVCKELKPLTFFHKNRTKKQGCNSYCNSCASIKAKLLRASDPEFYTEYSRKATRKSRLKKFGISPEEFDKLYNDQAGCCSICMISIEKESSKNKRAHIHIDHDHVTGKVRGLLCVNCNIGLGQFKDSPILLEKAIHYLMEKKEAQ